MGIAYHKLSIKNSLGIRVLWISFLLFSLPIVLYFFIVLGRSHEAKLNETINHFATINKSKALLVTEFAEHNFNTIDLVSEMIDIRFPKIDIEHNNQRIDSFLKKIVKCYKINFISYISLDKNNNYVCHISSDTKKIGKNYNDYLLVEKAMKKGKYVFFAISKKVLSPRFYISKKVKISNSIGVVTAAMDSHDLMKKVIGNNKNNNIHFSLLTKDKLIFESTDNRLIMKGLSSFQKKQIKAINDNQILVKNIENHPEVIKMNYCNENYIAILKKIPNTDLMLLSHIKEDILFKEEKIATLIVISLAIFLSAIGSITSYWLTRKASMPLNSLAETMFNIKKGDLSHRYKKQKMGFEINILGDIFNETMDKLIMHQKEAANEKIQKEILTKELEIGHEIQMSILPSKMPQMEGIELIAHSIPAKHVCGDFYDVFKRKINNKEQMVLVVADAVGKGISACLFSLCVRSILRSYYNEIDSIAKIMKKTNSLFYQDTQSTNSFVTALAVIFDPSTKILTFSSCGHNPGVVVHKDGALSKIKTNGVPLGIFKESAPLSKSIQLQTGDTILIYTDGLVEASNKKEMFGEENLLNILKKYKDKNINTISENILTSIKKFTDGEPQSDDITFIIAKVN